MIELESVRKRYPAPQGSGWFDAVHPTSLRIAQGEIFGLIGQSGAGKSTLLRLINLLERPDDGQVRIDGQDLMQLDARGLRQMRQKIGMVFQQFNLMANPELADLVPTEPQYTIYRSTGIVPTRTVRDPKLAQDFIQFLRSQQGELIFRKWGWMGARK